MPELGNQGARPKKRRPVLRIAAALLGAAVFCQPGLAHAAHGGGGFHGGGFHGGGFHAGGFHGGAFHHGAFHGGGSHSGVAGLRDGFAGSRAEHWNHGWHNGRYGWWWGEGYSPYDYGWYGYPEYNYTQPYASQTWYYCSDPAGYYPYVTQCGTGWQSVPAS
jgi:hypothetical protein